MKVAHPQRMLYIKQFDEPLLMLGQIGGVLRDLQMRLELTERLFQQTEDALRAQGFPPIKLKITDTPTETLDPFASPAIVKIGPRRSQNEHQ